MAVQRGRHGTAKWGRLSSAKFSRSSVSSRARWRRTSSVPTSLVDPGIAVVTTETGSDAGNVSSSPSFNCSSRTALKLRQECPPSPVHLSRREICLYDHSWPTPRPTWNWLTGASLRPSHTSLNKGISPSEFDYPDIQRTWRKLQVFHATLKQHQDHRGAIARRPHGHSWQEVKRAGQARGS